ncbi:MAG: restriction endonuclease subunit S [Candidatus Rifleibacteriota bacterium]
MSKNLPKGWVETTLKKLGIITTGNTPPKKNKENYGNSILFVKPGDLGINAIINSTTIRLSNKGGKIARLLPPNTIMVTCIGSLGKVGIAGQVTATNQQINSIQFYENCVIPKFGYYACLTLKSWLEKEASATTLSIINKSKFSNAPFILPPLNEQKRIVAKLDRLLTHVDAARSRLDSAASQC